MVLTGHGGAEDATGVVTGQSVLEGDPPAVQSGRRRPALVDVVTVVMAHCDNLAAEAAGRRHDTGHAVDPDPTSRWRAGGAVPPRTWSSLGMVPGSTRCLPDVVEARPWHAP